MKRAGFTLLELMLSIVILGMIVTFLMQSVGDLKQGQKVLLDAVKEQDASIEMLSLLYDDILASTELKTKEYEHYTMLELRTQNSLYAINHPYVRWFGNPKTKTILRSESAKPYLPPFLDERRLFEIHLDAPLGGCNWFKAQPSSKKEAILVAFECEGTPIVMEFLTPQFEESNGTKKP